MKSAAGRHSLQWRLSAGLSAAILLTAAVAGSVSFAWALHDANEILDGTLQDTAAMIARGQMALPGAPAQLPGSEPDNDVLVVPLSTTGSPPTGIARVLAPLGQGMHTVHWDGQGWRTLVTPLGTGARVAVAQRTEVRDEIALHSAIRTLIPLLVLVPLLLLIVRAVVRRTLRPIATLARHVDSHAIGPAARLPRVEAPDEIAPFLASIRRLLQELTEALEQQHRFVANAAHELRSPMAALLLQAANIERVVAQGEARTRVEQLRLGLERMKHLLEQLLEMARSEAGDGGSAPVRWADIAAEVLAQCVFAAEAKGIDLGMDGCERDLCVAATALDLRTLLRNVVDNAIKYAPPGSSVTVSVYRDGEQAVLAVEDQGPGIAEAHLQHVFEPFYRVPGTVEAGSGLGLAIVDALAKRLHGRATLARRRGGPGLRFEYRQPALGASAPPPAAATAQGRLPPEAPGTNEIPGQPHS